MPRETTGLVANSISAEVTALDRDRMLRERVELVKIHPNVPIEVPLAKEGLQACRILRAGGVRVSMALVSPPMHALPAAKVGARFVSPLAGRLDNVSRKGIDLSARVRPIHDNSGLLTRILAASIRRPVYVLETAGSVAGEPAKRRSGHD